MNRVTWIRIGIVTVVVGIGTFAIWKAIAPEETKPAASKGARKASPKSSTEKPAGSGGAKSADTDPFEAAKQRFNSSSTIPASYVAADENNYGSGDRYSSTPGTAAQPTGSDGLGSFAGVNLPSTGDRYAANNSYTATQPASGDRYGSLSGSTTAGDTEALPGQSYTGDSSRSQDPSTTTSGNPLRGTNGTSSDTGGTRPDPFANVGGDRYGSSSRSTDFYGSDATSTAGDTGSSQAGSTNQAHDPFGSSRREPAHFGVGSDVNAEVTPGTLSSTSAATDSAQQDEFNRYGMGGTGAAGSQYRDTPLPGEGAGSSLAGDTGLATSGTPGSQGQFPSQQGDGNANHQSHNLLDGPSRRSDAGGYDPRQQPGPEYYGGSAAGAGQVGTTETTRGVSTKSSFDPFAEGATAGGYQSGGYANAQNGYSTSGYVDDGIGEPGDEMLEGPQSPQVIIQKLAPAEIQVGKAAIFEIVVRNDGDNVAHDVEVHDQIPRGTQLLRTSPVAQETGRGSLVWQLGNIPPREERVVKVELMPVAEGEIGSVATVHVAAAASVRTIATRPDLRLEVSAPSTVMIGEDVTLKIKVRNPGTGMAEGIIITERVPQELRHEAGDLLEYEVGQLEPGGTRELELTLTAAKAGKFINSLQASGEAGLQAVDESRIEVIAPALQVDMQGPTKRYLERPATYTISIANPGTAAAKDVELVAYVPQGMEFIEADSYGEYDQTSRVVRWSLEELPAAQEGAVNLKLLPTEAGEHRLTTEASAQKDLFDRSERALSVEGVAAILFEVVDVNDPIEVGAETTYEIRILNQGSKVATNIQLEAVMPPQMSPVDGEGPTRAFVEGNRVMFEPLAKLAPRADTKYRIKAKGLQAGDLRLTVRLLANEMTAPVIKEESTRVYADQ
ncbi:MAG: hypothetical protein MPJ50_00135 [Pirellulales bacterium]|nr:hypothetical protein [Pirellulales bacterium]